MNVVLNLCIQCMLVVDSGIEMVIVKFVCLFVSWYKTHKS